MRSRALPTCFFYSYRKVKLHNSFSACTNSNNDKMPSTRVEIYGNLFIKIETIIYILHTCIYQQVRAKFMHSNVHTCTRKSKTLRLHVITLQLSLMSSYMPSLLSCIEVQYGSNRRTVCQLAKFLEHIALYNKTQLLLKYHLHQYFYYLVTIWMTNIITNCNLIIVNKHSVVTYKMAIVFAPSGIWTHIFHVHVHGCSSLNYRSVQHNLLLVNSAHKLIELQLHNYLHSKNTVKYLVERFPISVGRKTITCFLFTPFLNTAFVLPSMICSPIIAAIQLRKSRLVKKWHSAMIKNHRL